MQGPLKYVRARTPQGNLTNFKTGDRFVDIVVPSEPLPKKKPMGLFTASLYHKEQKQALKEIECGNCKQTGHVRKDCTNDPVCYDCLKPGHKRGSPICKGKPDDESGEESDGNNSGDESSESENQDENADDHMVTVEEHSSEIEEHRKLGEKSGESAISDAKEGSMDDKGVKLKFNGSMDRGSEFLSSIWTRTSGEQSG